MGIFDFIPTLEEVVEFTACWLTGHEWKYFERDGQDYRICETCNKKEKV